MSDCRPITFQISYRSKRGRRTEIQTRDRANDLTFSAEPGETIRINPFCSGMVGPAGNRRPCSKLISEGMLYCHQHEPQIPQDVADHVEFRR